jgi:hypothetical protein
VRTRGGAFEGGGGESLTHPGAGHRAGTGRTALPIYLAIEAERITTHEYLFLALARARLEPGRETKKNTTVVLGIDSIDQSRTRTQVVSLTKKRMLV